MGPYLIHINGVPAQRARWPISSKTASMGLSYCEQPAAGIGPRHCTSFDAPAQVSAFHRDSIRRLNPVPQSRHRNEGGLVPAAPSQWNMHQSSSVLPR
jgi:hypothetical protein